LICKNLDSLQLRIIMPRTREETKGTDGMLTCRIRGQHWLKLTRGGTTGGVDREGVAIRYSRGRVKVNYASLPSSRPSSQLSEKTSKQQHENRIVEGVKSGSCWMYE